MQVSPQIVIYILLLVPGLLGHSVFSAFTYTAQPTWSGRTAAAIVLAAISYVTLGALHSWLAWLPDPQVLLSAGDSGLASALSTESLMAVLCASLFGLVYSLLLVAGHNRRLAHRLARRLGLTTKSGFISEWDSVMIQRARERWVLIAMKDGSAFTGWLESHDVTSEDRCIVLSKVRQYDAKGNSFLWPADEVLVIEGMSDVQFIRLIPTTESRHGQEAAAKPTEKAAEHRGALGESEPEAGARESATCVADSPERVGEGIEVKLRKQPHDNPQASPPTGNG